MKITRVDHITINLTEPEKSFCFYEEILELSRAERVDMGDHVLHLYELPGMRLELIEYKETQRVVQTSNTDVGVYRHFAVCVDDLEECQRRCEQAGYGINLYPEWIGKIGKKVMLIRDPNGVEIEIVGQ